MSADEFDDEFERLLDEEEAIERVEAVKDAMSDESTVWALSQEIVDDRLPGLADREHLALEYMDLVEGVASTLRGIPVLIDLAEIASEFGAEFGEESGPPRIERD